MTLKLVKTDGQGGADSARNIMEIPVAHIVPSPLNPRQDIDEEYLERLAASIRQHGVIEPIIVRRLGQDAYEVGPGKSRWLATKIAGRETVPAVIKENIDDLTWLQLMLAENLERKELNPLEEAQGFKELQKLGMKQGQIAELFHRSQPAIANLLRLLTLPDEVQEAIRQGQLTAAHGVALASYAKFPELVSKLAEMAAKKGLTSHDLEKDLPDTWALEQAGLIKRLGYGALFDIEACEQCPHQAYRHISYGQYCLYPAHYEELQEAADKARQERVVAEAARAKEEGKVGVRVKDLAAGAYKHLDSYDGTPAGCREDCDKRVPGIGYDEQQHILCLDPACHQRLAEAETRAKNKVRRTQGQDLLRKVEKVIDGITEISDSEYVLLATEVIKHRASKPLKAAFTRLGCQDLAELADRKPWQPGRPAYEVMRGVSRLTLVKGVIEAMLRQEINDSYQEQHGRGALPPWAAWYMGEAGDDEGEGDGN